MNRREYFVYIMASFSGTLYIGVTNDLARRAYQHKHGEIEGFSKKYGCTKLIYAESYGDIHQAIAREKQLKRWNRQKKQNLIKIQNPHWRDLAANYGY